MTVEELLAQAGEKIDRERTLRDQPEVKATLEQVIGYTLFKVGAPDKARRHLRSAVKLRQEALGADHPDTLAAQEDLAFFLSSEHEVDEALPLARQTWEARAVVRGPDHRETLESLDTYATTLTLRGLFDEANQYRQQALDARRQFGELDPDYLQSLGNRGFDYNEQGRHAEAEPVLREVIRLRIRANGPKDPELLAARNNLGVALSYLGRFDEAVTTARDALKLGRELIAPRAWQVLHLQHTLVRALYAAGGPENLDEAAQLGAHTVSARKEVLGPNNLHVGRTQTVLGLVYAVQGKAAEADASFRDALSVFRGKQNVEDWVAMARAGQAATLLALGRPDEATPLLASSWLTIESDRRIALWQKRRLAGLVAAGYEKAGNSAEATAWRGKSR